MFVGEATTVEPRLTRAPLITFYVPFCWIDRRCLVIIVILVIHFALLLYSRLKVSLPDLVQRSILSIQPTERQPEQNTTNTRQYSHRTVIPYKSWVCG